MRTNKKLRIIITAAAALTACAGAVIVFLKRKAIKRHFGIYGIIAAVMLLGIMGAGMTAYATEPDNTEPETVITDTEAETDEYDYSTEPDEVITGDEIEIDIGDFLDPERQTNQLTPPGNLTLVDDITGTQAQDKQFITVVTKNGNYFYIIIDRSGDRENVHFLNLVDEYDLLQILQGEDFVPPPLPPDIADIAGEPEGEGENGETESGDTPEAQPRENSMTGILIMVLVMAAIGGGAFYYFKVLKPKQGAKKPAVKNELDEFDFDADEDDFFSDSADEQDSGDYEDDTDEEIPDFTAKDEPTADSDDFTFDDSTGGETPESEGKE
jgi:flagellar basal body-associated protein FliL